MADTIKRDRRSPGRLEWSINRDGTDVTVSVTVHGVGEEGGFQPVDVLAAAGSDTVLGAVSKRLRDVIEIAAPVAGTLAVRGFTAPHQDGPPVTFALTVSLGHVSDPDADAADGRNVEVFDLPCGPGIRIHRIKEVGKGQLVWPVFTSTYLAQTAAGVLALAFATPHLDSALEFSALFDAIASTCMIS